MYFLTNHNEVQTLLREMNVKMLGRRDSMELDFHGFEQFLLQFAALIFLKSHTLHLVTPNGEQTMSENLSHLSHLQLVE